MADLRLLRLTAGSVCPAGWCTLKSGERGCGSVGCGSGGRCGGHPVQQELALSVTSLSNISLLSRSNSQVSAVSEKKMFWSIPFSKI